MSADVFARLGRTYDASGKPLAADQYAPGDIVYVYRDESSQQPEPMRLVSRNPRILQVPGMPYPPPALPAQGAVHAHVATPTPVADEGDPEVDVAQDEDPSPEPPSPEPTEPTAAAPTPSSPPPSSSSQGEPEGSS